MSSPVASRRSVIVSIVSGVAIAVIKVIAGIVSGSSAMISEAIHSCVDAFNSVFLLIGIRAAGRPPDDEHPFGHGRETYFWTLIVAIAIFAVGGAFSIYEGISHLREPTPLAPPFWNYVVLGTALIFESWTAVTAYREYRAMCRQQGVGMWGTFRASKDLTTFVVLFENSTAVIGILVALGGIMLSQVLRSPYPDGIASLLIGVMLCAVAFALIRESKGLIIGEGVERHTLINMRAIVELNPNVEEVFDFLTLQTGPGEVLVAMDLRFRRDLPAERVADVVDELESALRARYTEVARIFIEAERKVPFRPPQGPQPALSSG
jgi:cation diffusion facilitator family transporter